MASVDHAALMDRVYGLQRRFGFYDATRKYYLLGRDPMIQQLSPPSGGTVLEIGCGTGRNLVHVAQAYPNVRLHGIDISREMLTAAANSVMRAGIRDRTRLAWADASDFDPEKAFGFNGYDRIFLSYAVSMIPQWRAVIAQAVRYLAPGGELHIADFGDMSSLPSWSRTAMYTWLRWYHVSPRYDLIDVSDEIAMAIGGSSEYHSLHRGFSWICVIRKPDEATSI